MKLIIENTTKIVRLNGVDARIWEGHTESGIAVHCYITLVAVANGLDQAQFESELRKTRAPAPEVEAIPSRMLL